MMLLDQLERSLNEEESNFRAQLLREDIARLKALRHLVMRATSQALFLEHGLRLEWTPGALRNQQLQTTLEPLLEAFHAADKTDAGVDGQAHLLRAWYAFDTQRMDVLVGCLARVPRPNYD